MKFRLFVWVGLLHASVAVLAAPLSVTALKEKPKLILVLVIDQFRADYLTRFADRFLPARNAKGELGGFEYLKKESAYFPQAQYDLLQCMTGPGHATILTGAYPYLSGIPLNNWYDAEKEAPVYCAQDSEFSTVGASPKDSQVGTSPRNMIATTLGDELKNAGFPSRVVSISLKDRSAIFMGGHRADLALWMDKDAYQWVSSKYYLKSGVLPDWVVGLNQDLTGKKGVEVSWKVAGPAVGLSEDAHQLLADKKTEEALGTAFPHRFNTAKASALDGPYGHEVTLAAAKSALDTMKLGQGKSTDILAVSFSSHDYLGHAFGPNSREMEEMTLAGDKTISQFLNLVNKKVPGGIKNTLIVLTADHGIPPNPDWVKQDRMSAGRLDEGKIVQDLEAKLAAKFGKTESGKWILSSVDLNFYLNRKAIQEKNIESAAVETELRNLVLKVEGIQTAFTKTDHRNRTLPPGILESQILKTYFPGRSGDVIAIVKPFYFPGKAMVTHMTGYKYDTTVPLLLMGKHFKPGLYATPTGVVDIAPTLAFLMGVVPPAMSEGRVLAEALY